MSNEIIKVALPDHINTSAIEEFQKALLVMDDYRKSLAEAKDWESLCYGLTNLIEFKQNLAALVEAIQSDIYGLMPEKKTVIEGLGIFEKRRSNTKKWDSDGLLRDIVNSKLNNGTGEITPTDVFELIDTLKRVMPIVPSMSWRVTELKKENIDTDEYCDITWGRPTIQVSK